MLPVFFLAAALATGVAAHQAVWHPGMYCRGGNVPGQDDSNTDIVKNPLFNLTKSQWWMQRDRNCHLFSPTNGDSLALPAGGSFTVEIAENRAVTTLSYDGANVSDWPDGLQHPEDWHGGGPGEGCLDGNPDGQGGALHTKNQQHQPGSAFAISYQADINEVTMENLVVFTTKYHTPWKRLTTYEVPGDMPACPVGGCYCAWLWVPDGCGMPNMYMQNFKCHVTNVRSTAKPLALPAKPPVYCHNNPSACVSGPKQMIAWHQLGGNNVVTPGDVTPPYNMKMGFPEGAQNDIFVGSSTPSATTSSTPTSVPTGAPTHYTQGRLGCYTDDTPRVLPHRVDASYIPGGLTPEKCKTVCAEKGYAFAGTEFHEECYCGDAAPSSSVLVGDNECNDPCTGDGTTTCGAAWRVEVYETNAVWKGKGCYVDSGSPRVLPVDKTSAVSGQMTVTKCLEACSGYTFAGVEFGVECWCGGSILETNKAGNEDQCDMQCAGDGGEICGGGNRVSVYESSPVTWVRMLRRKM